MTLLRSLRGRVMMGAALWTLGLLAMIAIVLSFSVRAAHSVSLIHHHNHASAVIAVGCMLAGLALVRSALAPFDDMRRRLSGVRKGVEPQLHGSYPTEVQPLVDDLNALLAHNARAVARATAKAGDLAHGLKTPLAVLSREAERADAAGHQEMAATIGQQVERMRRQVDYHLAHARAAASGATPGARCAVVESAEGLARTLLRLHADRGLAIQVNVSPDHSVRSGRADVDEMLGNLLDNACRWARSQVTVTSVETDGAIVIIVDDDGPGLDPSMREAVLRRGVRADEASPGSGLGLAIVRDLAELYEGSISLGDAPAGGLRARLQLPAADRSARST